MSGAFLLFVSLAGRGGEGRNVRWSVFRFVAGGAGGSSGGSARAGRGGMESGLWRWCGFGAGGPGRRRRGWELGGGGELALRPCSFIDSRFRCSAADGSCGLLQRLEVPSSQRTVVRRRRWRLGDLGVAVDPIEFLPGGLGCFSHFSWVSCILLFSLGTCL